MPKRPQRERALNARIEYAEDVQGTWFFLIAPGGEKVVLGPPFSATRASARDAIKAALDAAAPSARGTRDEL